METAQAPDFGGSGWHELQHSLEQSQEVFTLGLCYTLLPRVFLD